MLKLWSLAKKSFELGPARYNCNTLGVAYYRTAQYQEAIESLRMAMELDSEGDFEAWNTFLLAMAHWQVGNKEEGRRWYDKAVEWMEQNEIPSHNWQLMLRFRSEAEALLGISQPEAT